MDLPAVEPSTTSAYTRRFWTIFLPLALSWSFMAVEAPLAMAVLGQAPDARLNAAALLVVFGIAIFLESPVIDLLSTCTTLGTHRKNYVVLSGFTWMMMAWVTVMHAAVTLTPLYDLVTLELLKVNPNVANAAHLPLILMIPWSACVGWRRSLQGFMIRHGNTRPISLGTFVRIATMAAVGFGTVAFTSLNGLVCVAVSLVCAVFAEAMFIHFASRPTIADLPEGDGETPVSYRRLFSFHLPLTASTAVMLTSTLFVTGALNLVPSQVLALAAWQTANATIFLFRASAFALPEAVISLWAPETKRLTARLCLYVGSVLSGLMLLFHVTTLDRQVFVHLYNTKNDQALMAGVAMLSTSLLPLVNAIASYYRGALTANHVTWARLVAIAASLGALALCLQFGVTQQWVGVVVAGVSVTVSAVVETVALALSLLMYDRRKMVKLPATT